MAQQIRNNTELKRLYKDGIYEEFVRWYALPIIEKLRSGIPDQNAFAKEHKVNKDTLSRWKQRRDFDPKVDQIRQHWTHSKMPDMLDAIYRSAIRGNVSSQRLWLKYTGEFDRAKKARETEPESGYRFIEVDAAIRQLISSFPQDLQNKYNSVIIDLSNDVRAAREGRPEDFSNSPKSHGV